MSDDTLDFPVWLQQQIKLREMTQEQFARRGGITPSQVSHVINRKRQPGEDFFKATAVALKMELLDIYKQAGVIPPDGGAVRFPYSDAEMRLIYLFRELPGAKQEQLIEYGEFLRGKWKG